MLDVIIEAHSLCYKSLNFLKTREENIKEVVSHFVISRFKTVKWDENGISDLFLVDRREHS